MKLSVVIVNYNVRYFIEQTLRSVYQSQVEGDFDVYVVDNASSDGSVEMIKEKFPQVHLIESKENLGFSGGNNLALRQVSSKYVLLLNPDTIVSEDTFQKCIDKMEEDTAIGAIGVKMIDGGGQFLPESKRGLPTPFVAFCKAFGLSRLFPKSELFNRYHLGHIQSDEEAEIDVLSGAYMFIRQSVMAQIGLLDEDFFMYGEDIDYSYRIQKAGFKNYYLPSTSIVHFKGESTKRGSLNYVKVFYSAMIIFAQKHFMGKGASLMSFLYRSAVILRAGMSVVGNVVRKVLPIAVDAVLILVGLRLMSWLWARFYFGEPDYFSSVPLNWHHSLYMTFWIFSMYMVGVYDKYYDLKRLWKSLALGTIVLLVCFSLMSSEWRPSRAVLLLGAGWTLMVLSILRRALARWSGAERKRVCVAIIGSMTEIQRAVRLMKESRFEYRDVIYVSTPDQKDQQGYHGTLEDLDDMADAYKINEVIFCSKDIEHGEIIRWMSRLSERMTVRIIPEEGTSLIASRYKNKKGELYAIDARLNITQPEYKRQKRILDIMVVGMVWVGLPILIWMKLGRAMIWSTLDVFWGRKTWVGYSKFEYEKMSLPWMKPCVFDLTHGEVGDDRKGKISYLYARDYKVNMDIEVIYGAFLT